MLNCADETAAKIDEEVAKRMKKFYEKAVNIIKENRDALDKIAEYLIEKETITGKEFIKMYREIKGLPEPEENKNDKSEEGKTAETADGVDKIALITEDKAADKADESKDYIAKTEE